MIYRSQQASLAALEVLAHVSSSTLPPDLKMLTLTIADDASMEVIESAQLLDGWRKYPAPIKHAELGTKWVLSQKSLSLKVPSSLIETENNILINPLHPEMDKVKITSISNFNFDDRLIK